MCAKIGLITTQGLSGSLFIITVVDMLYIICNFK
jgi:hypothetical protein